LHDDQQRCEAVMARSAVHVAVNTVGLLRYLVDQGLPELGSRAVAFEPAFPENVFAREPASAQTTRRRLMFYARPNHLRNLFYFGLQVLDEAVARGVLNTQHWEIRFVGAHVPAVSLRDGTTPERHDALPWRDYAKLAGTMDVAFCLMATPHPSYPPLDLAASGSVVLTNRFANKTDLSHYCDNILCAELEMQAMLEGLRQALALAEDEPERARRFESRGLARDWRVSLAPVLEAFAGSSSPSGDAVPGWR
jgi:O-antigen biosynthesis protein